MTDTSDAGHLADDLSAEVVDPWARHGWLLAAVWLVFLLFPANEVAQVTADRPLLRVVGWGLLVLFLSLIHISEPTRQCCTSRMPSSA